MFHRRQSSPSIVKQIFPLLILLLAFFLQMHYLVELRGMFPGRLTKQSFCGVDALAHQERALGLISGQYPGNDPWLFIPLYPAFIAIIYQLLGIHYYIPILFQSMLSLITYASLYAIGHKLFSRTVGILAGLALAMYAPLTYYLPCFDQSLLTIPLFTLTVFFLLKFQTQPELRWLLMAAAMVVLSALSRPTVLILLPAVILWLWLYRTSFKHFVLQALCFGGGALLLISPITWHNFQTTGEFILLSKNGGVNLFTGNNPDAIGLDSLAHAQSQPAVLRHIELQQLRKSGETSYSAEVFKYIRAQPTNWLQLMAAKTWLWFGEADKPLISPFFPLGIDDSSTLRRLPFEWQAIALMALLGILLVRHRSRQAGVLIWLVYGSFSFATIIFFIQLRFRLPFVPFAVIYAMALVAQGRQWMRLTPKGFWTVLLILLSVYPFLPSLWIFILTFASLGLWPAFKSNGISMHRWAMAAVWAYLIVGVFWIQAQAEATDVSQRIAHYLGPRLMESSILGQTFEMDCNGFNQLTIRMGTFDDNHNQPVILFLASSLAADEILYTEQFDGSDVHDYQWREFFFDPLLDSQGNSYFFFISSPTSTPMNSLTARGYTANPIDQYKAGQAYAGEIGRLQPVAADFAFVATCYQSAWENLSAGITGMAQRQIWGFNQPGLYWGIFTVHLLMLIVAVGWLLFDRLRERST